jgi:ribosome-associated protein
LLYKKPAILAAEAASDKKSEDIIVLDVRKLTPITDYFVIVTVNSQPQAQAVRDEIESRLTGLGMTLRNRQQQLSKLWLLLDFDGIIAHIFIKDAREFYNLERLWSKAVKVKWEK